MKCDVAVLAVALGGAAFFGEAGHAQELPRPAPADRVYQVFLLGNRGAGAAGSDQLAPTLTLLASQLATAGPHSAVVFLGDLLPCCGMPDSGAVGRLEAETRLLELVDVVRDFEGRVVFIPGENDWGRDDHVGWMSVPRIEAFGETALHRGNVFVPDDGFPGPDQVRLTDDLRLVALNTQWLLTDRRKPTGDAGDYDVEEDDDVYLELEDLTQKRSGEDLLVVGHHPLYLPCVLPFCSEYGTAIPARGLAAKDVRKSTVEDERLRIEVRRESVGGGTRHVAQLSANAEVAQRQRDDDSWGDDKF